MDAIVRMKAADLPEVLAIEAMAFDWPWTRADFVRCLRNTKNIGVVMHAPSGRVIGYMVYCLEPGRFEILNLAVAPDLLREGVGSRMIAELKRKLRRGLRKRITLGVAERNVAAQLFFRANGFRAVAAVHGLYDETDQDCYRMEYRVGKEDGGKEDVSRSSSPPSSFHSRR